MPDLILQAAQSSDVILPSGARPITPDVILSKAKDLARTKERMLPPIQLQKDTRTAPPARTHTMFNPALQRRKRFVKGHGFSHAAKAST